MVAEGIVGGKVVCQEEKMPSRRSTKLRLYVDEMGKKLVADGSDFVVVVCEVTDDLGHVRRLASPYLREQQLKAEGMIENARMAVLMDAGLEYGIHPRKKRQAGERLALLALSNTYEVKGLPDFAVYKEVTEPHLCQRVCTAQGL